MLTQTLLATLLASTPALPRVPQGVDESEADLRARAARIHHDALTLDTHKDIRSTLARTPASDDSVKELRRDDPRLWGPNQVDFPKMRAGGLDVAFYIVYVGQGELDAEGFANARRQADAKFDAIERMARRFPGHIGLARSADDVERIAASGRLVACIGIENGYAMGEDLGAIAEFHARGARYMSITHNRHSQLGDSNTPEEGIHGGLSELGRLAIDEMNRVGIMVDVSHASKVTTLQAIARSKAPVIASHSSTDAVLEHGRNLSDEELLAIRENGGVVQCVAFASYVKDDGRRDFVRRTREELGLPPQRRTRAVPDDPEVRAKLRELRERVRAFDETNERADVSDFVDHIDHAVEVAGIDHVGISSDFDGGGGIVGWSDASETPNVTLELVRRGYTEEQIRKMWSGNTLRVLRAVEEVARELVGPAGPPAGEIAFSLGGTPHVLDLATRETREGGAVEGVLSPVTSPEGERAAAHLPGRGDEPRTVRVIDLESQQEWDLGQGTAHFFLNKGELVMTPASDGPLRLTVVEIESGARHALVHGDGRGDDGPATLSPDRSRVAWLRTGDRATIWTARVDGADARELAEAPGATSAPAFSPDGRHIAYEAADEAGTKSIWLVPTAGGEPRRLAEGSKPVWHGAR